MTDINYRIWPDWLEYGCRIKMRDDLVEQESTEMYGVCLTRKMMDELSGQVFELITPEEYIKREINNLESLNTAIILAFNPNSLCIRTKGHNTWWLTPWMIELVEEAGEIGCEVCKQYKKMERNGKVRFFLANVDERGNASGLTSYPKSDHYCPKCGKRLKRN